MGADALPDGIHILNGLTLDEWALGQQQEITMGLGQYQSSYSQFVELDITRIFGPMSGWASHSRAPAAKTNYTL